MGRRGPLSVPIILLFTVGAVYPLIFTMNKIAVEAGTPPVAFTFWQTLAAAVLLLILAAWRRELPRLEGRHLKAYFVIGLFGIAAPIALITWLAPKLPTGILSLVVIMSPPITYLIALTLRLERVRTLSLIGVLCGVGGILLMVVPAFSLPEPGMVVWFLLALLAPASFALTNNLAALIDPPETPVLSFASGIVAAATIMLAPMMVGLGETYVVPGPDTAADLAILGAAGVHHHHVHHLPHHRPRGRPGLLLAVQLRGGGGGPRLGHPLLRRAPQRLCLGRRGADAGGRRPAHPRGAAPAGDAGGTLSSRSPRRCRGARDPIDRPPSRPAPEPRADGPPGLVRPVVPFPCDRARNAG